MNYKIEGCWIDSDNLSKTIQRFEDIVNKKISEGFIPIGGPFVISETYNGETITGARATNWQHFTGQAFIKQ